jgi:hypothetical protein
MPCKEYESLKYMQDMETSTWTRFTYPQNKNLRGGVGERKAKQLAKEARERANEKGQQMHWHRESCEECK